MLDAGVFASAMDVVDHVVGVFLQRVVDARFEIRLRAVVIDAQAAADVEIFQPRAAAGKFSINSPRFAKRRLDLADVDDLAALMVMQQLEAIGHAAALRVLPGRGEFRSRSGRISSGSRPTIASGPSRGAASFTRMPIVGRTPIFSAYSRISPSSVYFSTTGMILRPIFWASIAVSMNSASLKPLQMMGVSFEAIATTASNSGLLPASSPNLNGRPNSTTSSTTCRCWFTLIG